MNTSGIKEESGIRKTIHVRLFAELNDFLPTDTRQKEFSLEVKTPILASELLESIGIPLSEVDLILVNSKPVNFKERLYDEDRVSVYPTFESFDISGLETRKRFPLRITRFILDAHLGKLAKYLRMLGFDTLYRNDFGDEEIIAIALSEKRIILTRDKLLLKSPRVSHGYYVRATDKHEQLREVTDKFDLCSQFKSFTRCMTCNSTLSRVPKKTIQTKVPPAILQSHNDFFLCQECNKVFWKGSHFKRMEQLVLSLLEYPDEH